MTIRLFVLAPTPVFRARVNQATFTYPLAEVVYDGVSLGAYTDIQPEMTVTFGTGQDDWYLGRQRIRKIADASKIYFGRSSPGIHDGEVDLLDDAHITVWDDYRPWGKVSFFDVDENLDSVTMYKDHDIEVGTYTTTPPPVANCGPGFAATVESGYTSYVVEFDGSNSFATADGATITDYLWDAGDGVVFYVGYSATDAVTRIYIPVGFRWVTLYVTDSNGKSHAAHCPVFIRDPDDDDSVNSFVLESVRLTQQGQEVDLQIFEDLPWFTYPDGTLVMLWEDEPDDGTDRTHMRFIGWHHTDPSDLTGEQRGLVRNTTLHCLDVAGKLKHIAGFSQVLENDDTPTQWIQMKDPNIDKYLHYLLQWHSNVLDLADFTWTGVGSSYPFVALISNGQSLWEQASERAQSIVPNYVLTCNRRGQLRVLPDPFYQEPIDRTNVVQATYYEDYWTKLEVTYQRAPRVYWLHSNAIIATDTPSEDVVTGKSYIPTAFCIAPGMAPGQGEEDITHGEQLAISQEDLNACEGHRYARLNAPESHYHITLASGTDPEIDPADMTWVVLQKLYAYGQRQHIFEATVGMLMPGQERGLPLEVNIRYRNTLQGMDRNVEIEWERETEGYPATTIIPEADEDVDDGNNVWPIPGADLPPIITLLGSNPMYIYKDQPFVDPGATAYDQEDGDITGDIVQAGSVNNAVVGPYLLVHNVTDSAGNNAATKVRTVYVREPSTMTILKEWTIQPEIGDTFIEGTDIGGGIRELTFTADEEIQPWDAFIFAEASETGHYTYFKPADITHAASLANQSTSPRSGYNLYLQVGCIQFDGTQPGGQTDVHIRWSAADYPLHGLQGLYVVHMRGVRHNGIGIDPAEASNWGGLAYHDLSHSPECYDWNSDLYEPVEAGYTLTEKDWTKKGTFLLYAAKNIGNGACSGEVGVNLLPMEANFESLSKLDRGEGWQIGVYGPSYMKGFTPTNAEWGFNCYAQTGTKNRFAVGCLTVVVAPETPVTP